MDTLIKVVPTVIAVLIVIAREVSKILREAKNKKMRVTADEIAVVVEALYEGCTSDEKLRAFKNLCEQRKIEVDEAVRYLEKTIIPISKSINTYTFTQKKTDGKDDKGVTN